MCKTVLDHDNWERAKTTYLIAKIIVDGEERILNLRNKRGIHAEMVLIKELKELNVSAVTLYMNNSPCYQCATALIKYLDTNDDVKLTLFVTCLYRVKRMSCEKHSKCIKKETENNKGLKNLKIHYRCTIKAFTIKAWKELLKLLEVSSKFRKQFWKEYYITQSKFVRSRKEEDKYIRSDLRKI